MDMELKFLSTQHAMSDEGLHISVPATDTLLALAQDPLLWRATSDPLDADSPEVNCAQAVPAAGRGPTVHWTAMHEGLFISVYVDNKMAGRSKLWSYCGKFR